MRLIQFTDRHGNRRVGQVINEPGDGTGGEVRCVTGAASTRALTLAAIEAGRGLAAEVAARGSDGAESYAAILDEARILVPLDHEQDPAHCLVSGTGLTHLGSAATRDKMHQAQIPEDAMTDTMRVFRWGIEGGRPPRGTAGVQPEWFYKGDGGIVVAPGAGFPVPAFAEDAGEEPELTGLYVVGPDGRPFRVGFALGNEFSDHVMERKNYLYLAHSKLRYCSYGPELRVGALPRHVEGASRIRRNGAVLWEKPFLSGEDNMCHSIDNLEYHHFKYAQFLRPGDVHVHFFGTATLSFADGIVTRPGDVFEIEVPAFGAALRNAIERVEPRFAPGGVVAL